ncbi:MAG: DEAD/DEAH box helicase [Labilithrix sp.]|nr:DEAD/DEAH box helicase [Labilithrix sp.]MCW5816019.1 DEAD/DEAH box helicase [Labilithrix sp.]
MPNARAAAPTPKVAEQNPSVHPFAALGLHKDLVRAVAAEGYSTPTPIQGKSIGPVLAGRDLLGCAQTGTGKTAAFVLPILHRLGKTPRTGKIRCLVVAPTRELAAQIDERIGAYGRHTGVRHICIYGGVGQKPQEKALERVPDILVATPGRLLDLMSQGFVKLDGIQVLVLDEADRMLDMGFIHDVRKIVAAVPPVRQTLLFSATIPGEIANLIASVLKDPVRVDIAPEVTTAERVEQCVHFVASKSDKRHLLEKLLRDENALRTIVFTRTKHGANRLAEQLTKSGIVAAAIHGNKSQGARERALEGFKGGTVAVLVATDLAARGIDVDGITHVFNFDLPNVPESYVHRIGRTGRAGASGRAIAFCDPEERPLLRDIEKFVKRSIPVAGGVALAPAPTPAMVTSPADPRPSPPRRSRGRRGPRRH